MTIISEISFISIDRPSYAVIEIHGRDIDTKKLVKLKAKEPLNEVVYIHDPESRENLILQQIKLGSQKTDSFFVADESDPTKNLLVEWEKKLTGQNP